VTKKRGVEPAIGRARVVGNKIRKLGALRGRVLLSAPVVNKWLDRQIDR